MLKVNGIDEPHPSSYEKKEKKNLKKYYYCSTCTKQRSPGTWLLCLVCFSTPNVDEVVQCEYLLFTHITSKMITKSKQANKSRRTGNRPRKKQNWKTVHLSPRLVLLETSFTLTMNGQQESFNV